MLALKSVTPWLNRAARHLRGHGLGADRLHAEGVGKLLAGLVHHGRCGRGQRLDGGALVARRVLQGLQQRVDLLHHGGAFLQREGVALGDVA